MCVCRGRGWWAWFAVHVHLGLSSRTGFQFGKGRGGSWGGVEGGKPEGRRVRSGWLATCLDDISRFIFVFLQKGGVVRRCGRV